MSTKDTKLNKISYVKNPKVHVVFVHGLDGNYVGTWGLESPKGWRSWIGEKVPDAQIWSLSYQIAASNWFGGAIPIVNRALQCLVELYTVLEGDSPIIFVCHSYGGLLLKEISRLAKTDEKKYCSIIDRVHGVVFFATPHQGSQLPGFFMNLDGIISRNTGISILKLFRKSVAFDELERSVPRIVETGAWYSANSGYPRVRVEAFYETQKTYGVFQVVDEFSAKPGIEGVAAIALDNDHIMICKPDEDHLGVRITVKMIEEVAVGSTTASGGHPFTYDPKVSLISSPYAQGKTHAAVIGAVMADIIVSPEGNKQFRDKIGFVEEIVIGGCAFNIFWHLRQLGIDATLCSVIPRNSIFKNKILEAITATGSTDDYINYVDQGPEPLFLAQRNGASLAHCVSSTATEAAQLDYDKLASLLARCRIAVIDLSLSSLQISAVNRLCVQAGVELICNGTSDGRIGRLSGWKGQKLDALICSADEFKALTGAIAKPTLKPIVACAQSFCHRLIVTRASHGCIVYDAAEPNAIELEAGTDQSDIVSTMGAGDALTAVYASARFADCGEGAAFSTERFLEISKTYMPKVLSCKFSTPR